MPGRNAQPIALLKSTGRKHLTKKEIEEREAGEIKFGTKDFKCPEFVKNDINAYKKWTELMKAYRGVRSKNTDIVRSPDAGILARYCITYSEYLRLVDERDHLLALRADWSEYNDMLPKDFRDGIVRVLRLDPLLQVENMINKKMDMLLKMEDRLFLNPLSKVKNIPRAPASKAKDPNATLFD